MDILYKLPFPKEVCSKIFYLACKSPHSDLSIGVLKNIIGLCNYNNLLKNGGIVMDGDGNVVKIKNNSLN